MCCFAVGLSGLVGVVVFISFHTRGIMMEAHEGTFEGNGWYLCWVSGDTPLLRYLYRETGEHIVRAYYCNPIEYRQSDVDDICTGSYTQYDRIEKVVFSVKEIING
jgi:hypothetical protein